MPRASLTTSMCSMRSSGFVRGLRSLTGWFSSGLHCGGAVNGFADSLVRSAAADVPAHRLVNLRIAGVRLLRQQRSRAHNLSRLAIPALRHIFLDPRFLHRMAAVVRQAFDGRNLLAGDAAHRSDAGALRVSVNMHGAGAAERHAATELGAGEVQGIAEHPEQGHLGAYLHCLRLAVQHEANGHSASLKIASAYLTPATGPD